MAKYDEWITEDGLIKLEGMARDGLTDEQIAQKIGIVPSTLYEWKKNYSVISESLKRGKEVVDRQVESALLKRALGFHYEEEKIFKEDVDGVVKIRREIIKKHALPEVAAQIFWLKNRMRAEWKDRVEFTDEKSLAKLDTILGKMKNG